MKVNIVLYKPPNHFHDILKINFVHISYMCLEFAPMHVLKECKIHEYSLANVHSN
jgi:hypothetical protein